MDHSMLGFLGDMQGDIQTKVDENLRLAGSALATNNLRNAEQFAQAALAANSAMLPINASVFQANNDLAGKILQQVQAAKNPASPPANSPDAPPAVTDSFLSKIKKIIGGVGLLLVLVGLVYFWKSHA